MPLKLRRFSRNQTQRADNDIADAPRGKKTRRATTDGALLFLAIAKESTDMVPMLKGVLGGVNTIIDLCRQFRSNEEDWKGLVEHIEALCAPIRRFNLESNQSDPARPEVEEAIKQLEVALDGVYSQLLRMKDRHGVVKLLQTKEDTKRIAGFRQGLSEAFQRVHLSLHISNTKTLREIQQMLQTVSQSQQILQESTLQDGTGSQPDPSYHRDFRPNAVHTTKRVLISDSEMYNKKPVHPILAPFAFFFF